MRRVCYNCGKIVWNEEEEKGLILIEFLHNHHKVNVCPDCFLRIKTKFLLIAPSEIEPAIAEGGK